MSVPFDTCSICQGMIQRRKRKPNTNSMRFERKCVDATGKRLKENCYGRRCRTGQHVYSKEPREERGANEGNNPDNPFHLL